MFHVPGFIDGPFKLYQNTIASMEVKIGFSV